MLSVGFLVVYGTLLVDVILYLFSWLNFWYIYIYRVLVDINKVKKLNYFFFSEFEFFFFCWIIVMGFNSFIYWMWMNLYKMYFINVLVYICVLIVVEISIINDYVIFEVRMVILCLL